MTIESLKREFEMNPVEVRTLISKCDHTKSEIQNFKNIGMNRVKLKFWNEIIPNLQHNVFKYKRS